MEIVKLPFQKLKVVHVVRYLEEVILPIKQRARVPHVILVSVIQRRVKVGGRMSQQDVTGAMANCATTQNPPPQNPVPPPDSVSVYLHRNVQKSTETHQTLQAVSVVRKDVLLIPASIALNLLVRVVMDQHVVALVVQ